MLQMKVRYSDYFAVERSGATTIVRFEVHSILDTSASEEVAKDLYALVDAHGIISMVLDLAGVRFLSSQTLGTLVALQRKARAAGGGIALAGVGPNIARMFRITRLDSLLTIQEQADPMPEPVGPGGCALALASSCPTAPDTLSGRSGPARS
jgi:anti-sigma B factor antagonist